MARGIPRPSILEVPDLFSLLDSPRNRFNTPRLLEVLENWILTFSIFVKKSSNKIHIKNYTIAIFAT